LIAVDRLGSGIKVTQCQFSNFRFTSWGSVLGVKGKCPGEYARGGMSRGEYPTLIGTMRPEHLKRWRRTISAKSASNYVEQIFDLCTK